MDKSTCIIDLAKLTEMFREDGFAATEGLDGEDDGGYYYGIDIANG